MEAVVLQAYQDLLAPVEGMGSRDTPENQAGQVWMAKLLLIRLLHHRARRALLDLQDLQVHLETRDLLDLQVIQAKTATAARLAPLDLQDPQGTQDLTETLASPGHKVSLARMPPLAGASLDLRDHQDPLGPPDLVASLATAPRAVQLAPQVPQDLQDQRARTVSQDLRVRRERTESLEATLSIALVLVAPFLDLPSDKKL